MSALGKFDPNIDYEWNPLWQSDDATKADIAVKKAQATYQDVQTGLINEDALRRARINQLIQDDWYPGLDDAIDEFGEAPEEPDVQVPWSRLAGAMAQMMPKPGAPPSGGPGSSQGAGGGPAGGEAMPKPAGAGGPMQGQPMPQPPIHAVLGAKPGAQVRVRLPGGGKPPKGK